ncbi:C-type lectin domain family 17, member A-like isoform X2 [Mustelus asterias]
MKNVRNSRTAPSGDDSELTYSELNFAAASQNSTIHTSAEPETTYAQIAVRSQSAQPNAGSEVAPGKDQRQQETAGGTNSKKSRCLGLVALLIIISLFAIIIGLTVYVLQLTQDFSEAKKEQRTLRERGDWLNASLANSVRNLTEMSGRFQNISETLSQSRQKAISLCATLRNMSDSLCPSGWKLHNHSCYRFSIATENWDTAKRECESLNSHLLIINTDQEQNFAIKSMPDKNKQYFIGLTDRGSEGNWKWVDGTPVSKSHWLKNQPDNWNGDEHCGTVSKVDGEDVFGWNDVPCSMEFPFICEKLAPSSIGAAAFEKYCP